MTVVVNSATVLRQLKEREDLKQLRLAELRKDITVGSEQAGRGELVDGAEVFRRVRAKSAQHKTGRK